MKFLRDIIAKHEDWLMERVLQHARLRGYTKYTSTLAEAWRQSIAGLSAPLIAALEKLDAAPELGPDEDYTQDPIAAFGIIEARRHRQRGISLDMFLGLMKYYRQSYLDLVGETDLIPEDRARYLLFLERFFDRVELGFCTEWATLSGEVKLEELQRTVRDMTNEKNLYLTIFESLHDPVILLDQDHQAINWNYAAAELFGQGGPPGGHYYTRGAGIQLPTVLVAQLLEQTNDGEEEFQAEHDIETGIGWRRFHVKTKRMLDVSHKFTGTVIILNDITSLIQTRARLERYATELENRNEEVKQFAYIVSHDLRAPLVNLKGFAGELRRAVTLIRPALKEALTQSRDTRSHEAAVLLDTDVPEALDFIDSSVTRMDRFIIALLKLSRWDHRELKPEPIDLRALIEDILQSLQYQIEARHAQVVIGSLPQVVADRTAMEQILGNLLNNAVIYLEPGRPGRIEIQGHVEGQETIFQIADNGRGIHSDDLPKVFTPFRRAGRQDVPGEGMGLAYVQALIRRHGGRIHCDSVPGRGTTFTFTISNVVQTEGD